MAEAALLFCYYIAYVGTSVWLSWGDEPLHTDPGLRETKSLIEGVRGTCMAWVTYIV
jgi:hypothetical protein